MNYKPYKHLPPFKGMVLQNFPFIEEDFDAITNYQLLCKVVEYLKNVIANELTMEENITNLYNEFVNLKNYVDNYFANLDVQEEINNKLDEMAEDGTLQDIIVEYIGMKAEYIFPNFWSNAGSGDINLIKHQEYTILIDTHQSRYYENVKQFLNSNDVSHIDYFILTHYDSDHVGNFKNLVNDGYIDSNTHLYMPGETLAFTDVIPKYTDIKNFCNNMHLNYYVPFENEILNVGALKITFYNTNVTIMDQLYYYDVAGYKDYNNESLVFLLEHNNIKMFYGGDGATLCLKRIREDNFIKGRLDLIKIEHHGINQSTDTQFYYETKPIYGVQQAYIRDAAKNNFSICQATSLMRELGTTIYPCYMQQDYIKFTSFENNLTCDSGRPYYLSKQLENIEYYVDVNTPLTHLQDGSQEYPFSELMQCIQMIGNSPCKRATIHLADGHYSISHETSEPAKNKVFTFTGLDTRILIKGNSTNRENVVIEDVHAYNSNIALQDLTINLDNDNAIYTYNTKCTLNNVLITSLTNTQSTTHSGIILREHSKLTVENSKIDYANQCIVATESIINIKSLTVGTNINSTPFAVSPINNNIIETHNITFEDDSMRIANNFDYGVSSHIQKIYSNSTGTNNLNLLRSLSNVNWCEITVKSVDNIYTSTGRIYYPNGKRIGITAPYIGGNDRIYNKQCDIYLNGDNISIYNERQITINPETNNISVSTDNYFKIIRVDVGYDSDTNNDWEDTSI